MMNYFAAVMNLDNYFLNPFSASPALTAILILTLGPFVVSFERHARFNRSFLYLCMSATVALFGCSIFLSARHMPVAQFWMKVAYAGLIVFPAALLHVSVAYAKRQEEEKRFIWMVYALAALFIAALSQPWIINGVRHYAWGLYPAAGTLHPTFLIFTFFCIALAVLNLITYYRILSDAGERRRIRFLCFAFTFVSLLYIDMLPSYGIAIYPFGYIAALCFVFSVGYAHVRYHDRFLERQIQELCRAHDEQALLKKKLLEIGKLSSLASLSAGILHQVSQPITAIHGFAKFIKKEMPESDQFYKAVTLMEEQSVYLKEMIEDLMELMRHKEVKKENIDINAGLQRSIHLLTDELRIKRVEWDVHLAENIPQIYADAIHLQQVFMNCIINAIQALSTLPKGSQRHLKISSRFDAHDRMVTVQFQDNGPGLSSDDQKKIFEPFFSTKEGGSGVGLALCRDLISECGGTVDITSVPGQGATFIMKFPPAA